MIRIQFRAERLVVCGLNPNALFQLPFYPPNENPVVIVSELRQSVLDDLFRLALSRFAEYASSIGSESLSGERLLTSYLDLILAELQLLVSWPVIAPAVLSPEKWHSIQVFMVLAESLLHERLTLLECTRLLHLSPMQLSNLVRRSTGMTALE